MVEAVTIRPRETRPVKPFIFKILVSKFFENQILRSPLFDNPYWTRVSEASAENNLI
jgi:hypothetical protein